MLIAALRTVIIYIMIMLALRLGGKRQLGELQPAELVVTLLISDLASVPMQDNGMPLLSGLIPIAVLVSLELILSALMLKSHLFSKLVAGNPVVVIREGKLEQKALRLLRMTAEDLMENLRQQQVFDIRDVQYAIAETNGKISVCLMPDAKTVTPSDLALSVSDEGAPVPVVSDGKFVNWGMAMCGVTPAWVSEKLRRRGYSMKQVLLMTADKHQKVCIIRKEETP